jgi:lysyl-tRNA synthetase class 2
MNISSTSEAFDSPERLRSRQTRLELRSRVIDAVRAFFAEQGFLEVQTPIRVKAPAPELCIDAEPSGNRFLITSPELHMKRLLQAGYEKIFQLCHCFRKGERGTHHLPEFTLLEWYRLGGSVRDLMRDCEALMKAAASALCKFPRVVRQGAVIDLSPPFEAIEVADAFERFAGWRPGASLSPERFDRDLVDKVEPSLPADRPVFLTGYPAALASLARLDPNNPERAERFEMYAGGLELANGFQELTCPKEQRRRFEEEAAKRARLKKTPYPIDESFLRALALGLPESAGIALGVDRLVMLLTDAVTIDEVVAFSEG